MKIRNGFVSNSSSSSFIISKRNLSEPQIFKIKNHIEYASENFPQIHWATPNQEWCVDETDEQVTVWTSMDNFDMYEFLLLIGIDDEYIKYGNY